MAVNWINWMDPWRVEKDSGWEEGRTSIAAALWLAALGALVAGRAVGNVTEGAARGVWRASSSCRGALQRLNEGVEARLAR